MTPDQAERVARALSDWECEGYNLAGPFYKEFVDALCATAPIPAPASDSEAVRLLMEVEPYGHRLPVKLQDRVRTYLNTLNQKGGA